MPMKAKIYSVIFICVLFMNLPQLVTAQEYRPLAVDNAHWIVKEVDVMGFIINLWEYNCQGDTIVENVPYKKIFRRELIPTMDQPPFSPASYYSLFGFIRDDLAAKKVYARILENNYSWISCGFEQENLLFDFSLQPNDPINFCIMPSFYNATLSSTTTGDVYGVHTRIYFTSNDFHYFEGVGSQFGLFEDMILPVKSTNELEHTELYYYCASDPCPYTLPDVTLLTVGEVFDFAVGDQFQFSGSASGQPPNADRITITDKYFSQDNDTLFYQREHNSYYSYMNYNNGQPYLEYVFFSKTDTVSYTELDQPISVFDNNFLFDVHIGYSSILCDSLINRTDILNNPGGFPGDHYIREFGKGLGQTFNYYYSADVQTTLVSDKLFYYKKGNMICGVPDVVKVGSVKFESTVSIYPNPANSFITYTINKPISTKAFYSIFDCTGLNRSTGSVNQGTNTINIENLRTGIYLIKIVTGDAVYTGKFVRK